MHGAWLMNMSLISEENKGKFSYQGIKLANETLIFGTSSYVAIIG
jgi:hypothetical protein